MSHIISSDKDIEMISQLLDKFRSNGYKDEILEEILNAIIPQNKNFPVNIILGESKLPAFFSEKKQKIEISSDVLKRVVNKKINILNIKNQSLEKEIFYYFVLLALVHEVEHYYQCLIANNHVDFPYKIVVDGYRNLKTLQISKYTNHICALIKIIRFFFFYNGPDCLLERNANVEACDLLLKVAKYENNMEVINILSSLLSYQLSLGYDRFNNGSMEKTYKKKGVISVYNSFNHEEVICVEDRLRYGLSVDEETKYKVLKRQIKI